MPEDQNAGLRAAAAIDVPAGYAEHRGTVSVLMGGHNLRALNGWYRAFDQDLTLPLMALEIWLYATGAGSEFRAYPVAQLAAATELPRETARRKLLRLLTLRWLQGAGRRHVRPSAKLASAFGPRRTHWVLDDFMWTAARVRAALALDLAPAQRARLRADLAAAGRTSPAPLPAFSTEVEPAPHLEQAPTGALGAALGGFHLRHLQRLHRHFGGDLLLPLLLGEVALYTVSMLLRQRSTEVQMIEALLPAPGTEEAPLPGSLLRPCNPYSLALATGVPDSTVRRKIAQMVRRGWIIQTPDGLYGTRGLATEFEALNLETARDFLATEAQLQVLLLQR
jgi:hypothetical protein